MNGAHVLIRTLVAGGVDVCFANPGTSEMHFVAALDDVPEMRGGARAVRRRRDRRGRRVRPHDRQARGDVAAPRPRSGQRHRQPAQRAAGTDADREPRRRPRDLPPRGTTRRSPPTSTRSRATSRGWIRDTTQPESVARDAADAVAAALAPPGPDRDAHPPGRHDLARSRRAGGPTRGAGPPRSAGRHDRRGRQGVAFRRTGCVAARWRGLP